MRLFLLDQKKHLRDHFESLKTTPAIPYNKRQLEEKITVVDLGSRRLADVDLEFLWNYEIFPTNILTPLCQWHVENRAMKIGDCIVQQVYIPPLPKLSQKLIFGVKVTELIHEPSRRGFTYQTLEGHVEQGLSTFTIEENSDGLIFKIHTLSSPAALIAKILGPVFSKPYQAYCTRQALENVRRRVSCVTKS